MFPLIETIKIQDGIIQNIEWHQWRMNESFYTLFDKQNTLTISDIDIPDNFKEGIVKLRLLYNQNTFSLEYSAYTPKILKSIKLVFDDEIDYSLKYTNRSEIDKLLLKKGKCDDILIVKKGVITDSSYTNIVFYDGNEWFTPSTPLLKGTARQKLIHNNILKEKLLTPKDIQRFSHFKLINAMLDFEKQCMLDIDYIIL